MDYKKLYDKQWKKELESIRQPRGLRRLLFRYYFLSRYDITESLISSGERVLDVGCGEGSMLRRLSPRFKELYGLDVSSTAIQEAQEKKEQMCPEEASKFKFTLGNADNSLPFPDNFFDAIISIAAMEHIYDLFFLVGEMYRVLKPNGYVVVEVPNIAYLKHRLALLVGRLPVTSSSFDRWQEVGWDGGHIHYFTMKRLCWLFQSLGFHIEKKNGGGGFLAPFRNWCPSVLCGTLFIKAVKIEGV